MGVSRCVPISVFEATIAFLVPSVASLLAHRFLKRRWLPLLILLAFWATGVVVGPVSNQTFISVTDLLDTTELHHDHVVAALGILGVIGAVWAEVHLRRAAGRTTAAPTVETGP